MGVKDKKKNDMGYYLASNEEMNAAMWCLNNNIHISPLSAGFGKQEWYIEIVINKKRKKSPVTYKKVEIWQKMYEFYLYYYKKYKK